MIRSLSSTDVILRSATPNCRHEEDNADRRIYIFPNDSASQTVFITRMIK
jgi:hypothetical protein